jgi:CheY-like chemotaxis protein
LLNSLLDISRLDGGGVQVRHEDFALESLMHRLQDTYQSLAEEKGLDLMIRPTKACTHSDPALLERILGNLLSNAIRYTPSGGVVYAAVRPRGQDWLIQVRDNGPGIALQDQETIFQEFVQLSNPQRDRSLGLGLGLAIVQRLVKLLGHQVDVRSLPGQGATFGLRIPRASLGGAGLTTTDSPKATDSLQLFGLRILLVEDDELVRQSFAGLLGMWGARVDVFAQAAAALDYLQNQGVQPQLIITDHRLGGDQNGLELARTIAHQHGRPVSTLLITGDTEDDTLRRLSDPHIQVLYKPVKPNVLIANINRLLRPPAD